MRLAERRPGGRIIWPAAGAAAAAVSLAWTWSTDSARTPPPSPAVIVSSRFPDEWMALTPKSMAAFVLAHASSHEASAPAEGPDDGLLGSLLFDQGRLDTTGNLGFDRLGPRSAPSTFQPMQVPRPLSQAATLLNDAQIASIKDRLRLSEDQQNLWPAVEAALRALAWRGTRETLNARTATLDLTTVENLKTALVPFLKQLRTDQKDELRMIAHLMGIERMGSDL